MITISCFGDSITFGKTDMDNCWVSLLKKEFEKKKHNYVYNLGIPGDTSKNLLYRFKTEAISRCKINRKEDKHLILVSIGTNDARYNDKIKHTSYLEYRRNIIKIIQISKKVPAKLAFIGITELDESKTMPWEEYNYENKIIKKYNEIVKNECKKNKVPFLTILCKTETNDGLHPNIKQHKNMYNQILKFVKKII